MQGKSSSSLEHFICRYGHKFNGRGITNSDIPDYVLEAVYQGNIIGTQGKRNPRTIYQLTYNGKTQQSAVQVANNGYIVSANPKSMEG